MSHPEMPVKAFKISVAGWGESDEPIYARSRGVALADTWRCDAFGHMTFKEFLKFARARVCKPGPRFGEPITVSDKPGNIVSVNRQYIRFVYSGSDTIYNTHPLDVLPVEARRGTPYHDQS